MPYPTKRHSRHTACRPACPARPSLACFHGILVLVESFHLMPLQRMPNPTKRHSRSTARQLAPAPAFLGLFSWYFGANESLILIPLQIHSRRTARQPAPTLAFLGLSSWYLIPLQRMPNPTTRLSRQHRKIGTPCATLHKTKAIEQLSGVKSTWNTQVQGDGPMHNIGTNCETLHENYSRRATKRSETHLESPSTRQDSKARPDAQRQHEM